MNLMDYNAAVEYVLKWEGGLSENPNDPGGITNFGISLRFLKDLPYDSRKLYGVADLEVDHETIRSLSLDQAKMIYKGEFWDKAPFERLNNQNLVNYLFDMAVNMWISPAVKCAQRACWAIMKQNNAVRDDGIMGDKTIGALNQCGFYVLPVLRAERAAHYRAIVDAHPNEKVFLDGWLNRTYNEA